ncbi:MAG: GFA family protein [Pseudomonadota bacterium]
MTARFTVQGGCHCGAVRFEAVVAAQLVAHACNCSICQASGFVGAIIPAADFTLLAGESALSEYTFNTGVAKHLFCRHCGVKSFYRPRSNPDGVSLNIHLLELPPTVQVRIEPFDGQNWEQYAHTLQHLSKR